LDLLQLFLECNNLFCLCSDYSFELCFTDWFLSDRIDFR